MESREFYLELASTLDHFRDEFTKSEEKIIQEHSDWDKHDARLVICNKMIQILNGFGIGYSHLHREFINEKWFNALYPKELATKDNQEKLCEEFEKFLGSGAILSLYGAVESSLRIISHKLDSNRYSARMSFSPLYRTLLPELGLERYVDLLRIWTNLRNTVHNNSIFLPYDGKDQTIEYRNKKFVFENGKQHNLVGWRIYFGLIADLLEMVTAIIKSQKISSIDAIPDTSLAES